MNRGGKMLGVALLGATATCVDHPSAPPSRQIPTVDGNGVPSVGRIVLLH